jgi:Bacterial protein of unknown function (DUF899)
MGGRRGQGRNHRDARSASHPRSLRRPGWNDGRFPGRAEPAHFAREGCASVPTRGSKASVRRLRCYTFGSLRLGVKLLALELLEAEKELTRRSDELARRRQELPWVQIDKSHRSRRRRGGVVSNRASSRTLIAHPARCCAPGTIRVDVRGQTLTRRRPACCQIQGRWRAYIWETSAHA